MKVSARSRAIPDYVDTLDGFRAFAALLVMFFHYWQQSWVSMAVSIGPVRIDFTPIVSMGGLGVELLFVLSGFCLYYPLAMHPERRLRVGEYAYKRIVRILPTYFLCVLICSAYQIGRMNPGTLREQFIGNMTLTQMSTKALSYNQLNGVLWSIAIEVQFYVLFPLILPLFRKKPYWVALGAFCVAEGWRLYLRDFSPENAVFYYTNQLPPMLDAFIEGMLAAHIVSRLKALLDDGQKRALAPMFTLAAIGFFMLYILSTMYIYPLRYRETLNNSSILQLHIRKFVILGFAGSMAGSVMSCRWMHKMLGNPFTRFFSTISYQLYMWHMWIALRLKDFHIPAYSGETPMYDESWRMPYLLLSLALSLTAAVLMTYLVERPLSRLCLKHRPRWAKPKGEIHD